MIVGDGEKVWIYDADLNQVTVRKLAHALGATPAALLAGSADIEQGASTLKDAGATRRPASGCEAMPQGKDGRLRAHAHRLQRRRRWQRWSSSTHSARRSLLQFSELERNPKLAAPSSSASRRRKGADVIEQ